MFKCPKCQNTLPEWATQCQFCGENVQAIPRVRSAPEDEGRMNTFDGPPKYIWTLYYLLCAFWIIDGLVDVARTVLASKGEISGFGVVEIVFGVVTILVGIGLLLKNEFARRVVNTIAAINLLLAVLGLIGSLLSILVLGPFGLLYVIWNLVTIVIFGGMVWIIGVTRMTAPDI